MNEIIVMQATKSDIASMVILSYQQKQTYEKTQGSFLRHAEGSKDAQRECFKELLNDNDHIILVAKSDTEILGFIIGNLVKNSEAYNPDIPNLMIEDFCVKLEGDWQPVGLKLVNDIRAIAKEKGASRFYVVPEAHYNVKLFQWIQYLLA